MLFAVEQSSSENLSKGCHILRHLRHTSQRLDNCGSLGASKTPAVSLENGFTNSSVVSMMLVPPEKGVHHAAAETWSSQCFMKTTYCMTRVVCTGNNRGRKDVSVSSLFCLRYTIVPRQGIALCVFSANPAATLLAIGRFTDWRLR